MRRPVIASEGRNNHATWSLSGKEINGLRHEARITNPLLQPESEEPATGDYIAPSPAL
jgi:hypothetical protein